MVANLGYGALVITFLVSLYGAIAAIYGVRKEQPAWVDSARNAMLLTWPLLTFSAVSIIILLVTGRYEIEYVSSVELIASVMPSLKRTTDSPGASRPRSVL